MDGLGIDNFWSNRMATSVLYSGTKQCNGFAEVLTNILAYHLEWHRDGKNTGLAKGVLVTMTTPSFWNVWTENKNLENNLVPNFFWNVSNLLSKKYL